MSEFLYIYTLYILYMIYILNISYIIYTYFIYILYILSYVSNCPNIVTPHSFINNNFNLEDYSSYLYSHIKYHSCKSHCHEVYSDLRSF